MQLIIEILFLLKDNINKIKEIENIKLLGIIERYVLPLESFLFQTSRWKANLSLRIGMDIEYLNESFVFGLKILTQAKAAIQGGFRKGNARERSALAKFNNDGMENRREHVTNSSDSSR